MEILALPLTQFGHFAHLYVAGYQPGKKRRSTHVPLCGSQNGGVAVDSAIPLRTALRTWPNPDPATDLRDSVSWEWCRPCVGHAVALAGLQSEVLAGVVERSAS